MEPKQDLEILAGLRSRDPAALHAAIRAHGAVVNGMARRVTRDANLAEEIAQDCFVALWERSDRIDTRKGSIRSWLLTVARNKAVDRVRKEERMLPTTSRIDNGVADPGPDLEEAQVVRDALATLTALQREALFLAYFQGFTYREVAHVLGVSEGTAKTRLRDGLHRLRRVMLETAAA